MAAGWGITRKSENTEYTYKWTIEDFDFAMRVEGRVESASFAIPGVSGLFNLVAEEKAVSANRPPETTETYFSVYLKSTSQHHEGSWEA